MTFRLRIEMGNAEMCSEWDVADALKVVAQRLQKGEQTGKIMDLNGNTVGEFKFTEG